MDEEQKYLVEKNHEPIIDDETWEEAQKILKMRNNNYDKGNRNGPFRRMYAFSGITYCAFCGRLVTRKNWTTKANGKKAWYCSTAIKQGRRFCKDSKPMPEEVIEKCFLDAYKVLCADKATIIRKFMEKVEPVLKETNVQTELENLNMQEHDLKEKLKKLLDLKLDNLITEEAFKEKNYEIERKIKKIQKIKENKEINIEKEDSLKVKVEGIKELLKKNQILTEFDREIFNILVDKVVIGGIDENGNKNPYIINFVLKHNKENQNYISSKEEKRALKQDITIIDIENKNILCEIKSFQRLKIFEKDEDLFRTKKQLEFIRVRIVANYDDDIFFDIAN